MVVSVGTKGPELYKLIMQMRLLGRMNLLIAIVSFLSLPSVTQVMAGGLFNITKRLMVLEDRYIET